MEFIGRITVFLQNILWQMRVVFGEQNLCIISNKLKVYFRPFVDEYKIPKKYINGLDLLKSGKKKKK